MCVARRCASLTLVALLACGCAASTVVRWESKREAGWRLAARARGLGAWTTLRFESSFRRIDVSGELIAVGDDSLMILDCGSMVAVPTARIGYAIVEIREDSLLGRQHPLRPLKWEHPKPELWTSLARFARFPQGLPAGADSSIRAAAAAATLAPTAATPPSRSE